ncbi:MAG TPA: transglycosylase family protein, partial [Acidimicrobiales bacterium]|nr:transglycosylase family protein [Acidimicrobiales bacterium]
RAFFSMVRRLLAGAMVVLGLSGYVSLGCRALPPVDATPTSQKVHLAAVVTAETLPTTTTTTTAPPPPPTTPPRASRAAVRPRYTGPITDDIFIRLSWCEAGGRPDAVSRSGRYFGAFQFSLATWHSMGMPGSPVDFPYEVQLDTAKRLQARSGWGQWPVCARRLGLR